jgi:hypothetical protein
VVCLLGGADYLHVEGEVAGCDAVHYLAADLVVAVVPHL